jgi:anaerobic dimethyl sulfoxide reductase subunit C (anchor subunit)
MNDNFASLVFFTVLSQTAVGALIFRELVIFGGGMESTSFDFGKISLIIILCLLFLSLSIAFLHLGNPLHAYHAINNLGKSWLSREIFSLSLLIATLIVYVFIANRHNPGKTEMIFSFVSVLLGISLIFSMIRLYMIPAVASWNNYTTPVSFMITTLLSGITLLAVMALKNGNKFTLFALFIISILIIFSLLNSIFISGIFQKQLTFLIAIKIGLSILSLVIVSFLFFKPQSNKTLSLWVILFLIVFFSEIINRYSFFLSFDKSGL